MLFLLQMLYGTFISLSLMYVEYLCAQNEPSLQAQHKIHSSNPERICFFKNKRQWLVSQACLNLHIHLNRYTNESQVKMNLK